MTKDADVDAAEVAAMELADWARVYCQIPGSHDVRQKADAADLVTEVDTAVEAHVRQALGERFPEWPVVGEEFGGSATEGMPCWYVDPIDGTANFANGIPYSSFSLSLVVEGSPVLGVVTDIWRNRVFSARAGRGARINGMVARLDRAVGRKSLAGTIITTELLNQYPWPGMAEFAERMAAEKSTLRILGSGALSVAGVAAGAGAGCVIGRFGRVDHFASVLVVKEAGGVVWDEHGNDSVSPDGGGFIACSPDVVDTVFAAWSQARR